MIDKLFQIKLKEYLDNHIDAKMNKSVIKYLNEFDKSFINCQVINLL